MNSIESIMGMIYTEAVESSLCVLESPNEEVLEAAIHQTVDARVEIRGMVRLVKFVQRELGVRLDSDALIRLDSGALICIPQ